MSTIAPRTIRSTAAPALTAPTVRTYLRQSLAADKQQSIPTQRAEVERLARMLDITPEQRAAAVEYVDVNRSGGDFEGREAFARLQAEVRPGDFVLVWKLDRVARDITEGLIFIRELVVNRKCLLYTAETGSERIKCATAEDAMLVVVRLFGGQKGREDIRYNTKKNLRQRAEEGYATGRLPFGFRAVLVNPNVDERKKSKKRIEIDETTAPIVRRIFAMYLDGRGYVSIAKQLNSEGVPSPKGRTWSSSGIWESLRDPRYAGEWAHGVTRVAKRVGNKSIMEPAPEQEVIRWRRPDLAIIPPEQWEATQAALRERTTPMREALNASRHTLSGVTRCVCGSGLSVQRDGRPGKKVTVYQCARRRTQGAAACAARYRIRAELLEDAIRTALLPWFAQTRVIIAEAVAEVQARIASQVGPDVGAIERELQAAKGEQKTLVKLAVATGGDVAEVAAQLKEGQERIRRLEAALARATAPREDAAAIGAQIRAEAEGRLSAIETALSGPDPKEALRLLFPDGLRLTCEPDAYKVEAIGVLQALRELDGTRTACRIPFNVTIPKVAA